MFRGVFLWISVKINRKAVNIERFLSALWDRKKLKVNKKIKKEADGISFWKFIFLEIKKKSRGAVGGTINGLPKIVSFFIVSFRFYTSCLDIYHVNRENIWCLTCLWFDSKLHLVVRLHFRNSKKCRATISLPLLPGPLWFGMILSVRIPSTGQLCLKIIYHQVVLILRVSLSLSLSLSLSPIPVVPYS